ncbi:hypothetical protein [Nonomuraea sp. NPDC048901]
MAGADHPTMGGPPSLFIMFGGEWTERTLVGAIREHSSKSVLENAASR